MFSAIMGYPENVDYCPFCGEEIDEYRGDGSHICKECGAKFYVVEAGDTEREAE